MTRPPTDECDENTCHRLPPSETCLIWTVKFVCGFVCHTTDNPPNVPRKVWPFFFSKKKPGPFRQYMRWTVDPHSKNVGPLRCPVGFQKNPVLTDAEVRLTSVILSVYCLVFHVCARNFICLLSRMCKDIVNDWQPSVLTTYQCFRGLITWMLS